MTEEQQLKEDLQMICSGKLMERFASKYYNSAINIATPTLGGEVFWTTIYEVDGWKVQKWNFMNNSFPHYRILDPGNIRRAWSIVCEGKANKFVYDVHHFAELLRSQIPNANNGYGIVFSGGGGKGAYQIGVWKYLHEQGIDSKITGISGVSVGALNSLLFLQGDYDKACDIWLHVDQGDFTCFNGAQLRKLVQDLVSFYHIPAKVVVTWFSHFAASPLCSEEMSSSLFSQDRLKEIIHNYIDSSLVLKNLQQKEIYSALFSIPAGPYYPSWANRSFEQLKGLVLTSAAIPMVYSIRSFDGRLCVDGGLADNIPVKPLLHNYDHILVIHLSPKEREQKSWNKAIKDADISNKHFYHVYPSVPECMSSRMDMLTVNSKVTSYRMELGYQDAKEQLQKLISYDKSR